MSSYSYGCSHIHTITNRQATITAETNEFYVIVTLVYDPFSIATVDCLNSSNGQVQPPTFVVSVCWGEAG